MNNKYKVLRSLLLCVVAGLLLLSTAHAETTTNKTGVDIKEAKGTFEDMTGGLGFITNFLIGLLLKFGEWGLILCAVLAIIGYITQKPTTLNYGIKGFALIVVLFVIYAVGNIAVEYVVNKVW